MSQYAPPPNFEAPPPPAPAGGGKGLAIGSMICGILALLSSCVWIISVPLALVAIILGIIALTKSSPDGTKPGKGMALSGLICGGVAIVLSIILIVLAAIMLPALAKARQSAQVLKSGTQLRNIGQALQVYANANKDAYPESDKDWSDRLIKQGLISDELLIAPGREIEGTNYFYVPGGKMAFDANRVLVFENPNLRRSGQVVVCFEDGHVDTFSREAFAQILARIKLPDGKPYRIPE